jgi:hypothetical protein
MAGWWREPHKVAWALVAVLAAWALLFDRSSSSDDDDTPRTETTVTVEAFDAIEALGDIEMEIHVGSDESGLHFEGGDLDRLSTRVEGGKLIIDAKGASDVGAVIHTKALKRVVSATSGKTEVHGVEGDALTLVLNGSGKLEVDGMVSALSLELNGSGKIDAEKVTCESASAVLNGSGKIEVAEPSTLAVTIAGSGKVVHGGSPTVTQTINGSGKVAHR